MNVAIAIMLVNLCHPYILSTTILSDHSSYFKLFINASNVSWHPIVPICGDDKLGTVSKLDTIECKQKWIGFKEIIRGNNMACSAVMNELLISVTHWPIQYSLT